MFLKNSMILYNGLNSVFNGGEVVAFIIPPSPHPNKEKELILNQ